MALLTIAYDEDKVTAKDVVAAVTLMIEQGRTKYQGRLVFPSDVVTIGGEELEVRATYTRRNGDFFRVSLFEE